MTTDEVLLLTPRQRFWYWCRERHRVFLKKEAGEPRPWTDDQVLRRYFFTNPYRENDKVTRWVRENVRAAWVDDGVIFATAAFRWFNRIEVGEVMLRHKLLGHWRPETAVKVLGAIRDRGEPIFTGAFKINSPAGEKKLEAIVRRVTNIWQDRAALARDLTAPGVTMEAAVDRLRRYDGMGGFMAYELACDLRHTHVLENAPDVLTWCNPGPGCVRGLRRIAGEDFPKGDNETSLPKPKDWRERMVALLRESRRELRGMPPFEMREVEHSLCEYDKYERALAGDGKMRRNYQGV